MGSGILSFLCHLCMIFVISGSGPDLYLLTRTSVSLFNVETCDVSNPLQFPQNSFTQLAFGPKNHMVMVGDKSTAIYLADFNQTYVDIIPEPIIDTGLQHISGVVIDRTTSNIYVVDKDAGRIVVCTSRGDNCSILLDNLTNPVSIAIYAKDRSLFWSEHGNSTTMVTICRADLDGTNAKHIMADLYQPFNLVVDSTLDLLYWLDVVDGQFVVQSASLTGTNKREIIKSTFHSPHFVLHGDSLYITDGQTILIANKSSGEVKQKHELHIDSIVVPYVYEDVVQPGQNNDNPCESSPCSHVCVAGKTGYRCLCGVNDVGTDNGKCIKKQGEDKLLVSGTTGIYEVNINYIGYHSNRMTKILEDDVSCVVYDPRNDRIFYFADTRRAIMKTYSNALQNSLSVYSEIFRLEDMAFDASSDVIYWTTALGNVHVGSVDGSYSTLLISDLDKPRGITLDPETGYLYICDWGHQPLILQCHMDGTNCIPYIHVDGGHPNMVTIATAVALEYVNDGSRDLRKTLYWTDSQQDVIGYIHLDGAGVSKGELLLPHTANPHPYSIVVSGDRIYFTDWNTKHLHYIQGTNLSVVVDVNIGAGTIYSLASTSKPNNVASTICLVNNGGCSHICLAKPNNQRSCLTPDIQNEITQTDKLSVVATPKPQEIIEPSNTDTDHLSYNSIDDNTGKEIPPPEIAPPLIRKTVNYVTKPAVTIKPDDTKIAPGTAKPNGTQDVVVTTAPTDKRKPPSRHSKEEETVDTDLLAIFLVTGIVIVVAIFVIIYVLYQRRTHQKRDWMLKLIQYVKTRQSDDDGVGLVSNSSTSIVSEPSFKQYEDVDYPEDKYCLRHHHDDDDGREISIVSVDSAFNEMREFESYGSPENDYR